MDIFLKVTHSILFEEHDKFSLFNSTHYVVLYPQNGDRIVTVDSVTLLHPVYRPTCTCKRQCVYIGITGL